jgi:hypothetical protein
MYVYTSLNCLPFHPQRIIVSNHANTYTHTCMHTYICLQFQMWSLHHTHINVQVIITVHLTHTPKPTQKHRSKSKQHHSQTGIRKSESAHIAANILVGSNSNFPITMRQNSYLLQASGPHPAAVCACTSPPWHSAAFCVERALSPEPAPPRQPTRPL